MARRRHNSQTENDRRRLMLDFEQRIREADQSGDYPHQLFRPRSLAWVVHPLADEADLLHDLGLSPQECTAADCYWCFGDSVHFVQLSADPKAEPRIAYSFDQEQRQDRFVVRLAAETVTSDEVHRVLERLEAAIDAGTLKRLRAALPPFEGRWSDEMPVPL